MKAKEKRVTTKKKKKKRKTKKWKHPKCLNIFVHMKLIVPVVWMDKRRQRKMSMSVYKRANYSEFSCDSEYACNCAVNNINHVLNANENNIFFVKKKRKKKMLK